MNWENFWRKDPHAFSKRSYKRQLRIAKVVERILKRNKYKTVLDIGYGKAVALEKLAKEFPKINFYGYDISENIIKENKKPEFKNIKFRVADMNKLSKKFGVIMCFGVLAHELKPLNKINRLMKFVEKNGSLIINYPNKEQLEMSKRMNKKLPKSERKYWQNRMKLMYEEKNLITFSEIKQLGYPCKVIMKNPTIVQIIKK